MKPYPQDFIPHPKENKDKIMENHFYYLKSLLKQKKLFLAGPKLIPKVPFGFIILEAKTEEEAKELIENEPSIKAKAQKTADFRPIRVSLTRK